MQPKGCSWDQCAKRLYRFQTSWGITLFASLQISIESPSLSEVCWQVTNNVCWCGRGGRKPGGKRWTPKIPSCNQTGMLTNIIQSSKVQKRVSEIWIPFSEDYDLPGFAHTFECIWNTGWAIWNNEKTVAASQALSCGRKNSATFPFLPQTQRMLHNHSHSQNSYVCTFARARKHISDTNSSCIFKSMDYLWLWAWSFWCVIPYS